MKKIYALFFFILTCGLIAAQESVLKEENLKTFELQGKVKLLREVSFQAKKTPTGIVKSTKGWQYDFEYDSEYLFDTLGNLLVEYSMSSPKKELVYSIQYDSLHRISVVNRLLTTHIFNYDSLNRVANSLLSGTDSKKHFTTHFIYYYDSINQLIKIESFGDHSTVTVETFQYNSSGKLILNHIQKGEHVETHSYTYNERNLLIKEETKDNYEGILETTTYNYKDQEKILERWIDYEDGKPDGSIDDTFEKGNIVKTVDVDSDGTIGLIETSTYQFDSTGNWIRKTINSNEKYFIVERYVEYY
jgi:F0F1-type ATP synthase gamma subunit